MRACSLQHGRVTCGPIKAIVLYVHEPCPCGHGAWNLEGWAVVRFYTCSRTCHTCNLHLASPRCAKVVPALSAT